MGESWRALPGNPIDRLNHLLRLHGLRQSDLVRHSAGVGERFYLGRNFFSNIARFKTTPSVRQLQVLNRAFNLTIDGSYRIFDIDLDNLARVERLLNPSRTRIVETYVFRRDAPLPFPGPPHPRASPERSGFLKDIVHEFQQTTVRSFEDPLWSPDTYFYLQLAHNDDTAAPAIPRGGLIQAAHIGGQEAARPDPGRLYVVQHGHGYLCSKCSAEGGFLHLPSRGSFYQGFHRLRLREEAQIMGRGLACFVLLPVPSKSESPHPVHGPPAHIRAPWEHRSMHEAVSHARLLFGLTNREIDALAEQARPILGYGITGRHLRLLEVERAEPHMHTCLVVTPICSLRFQDVQRIHGGALQDAGRWSLEMQLGAQNLLDLQLPFLPVAPPKPGELWSAFFGGWHDLPMLLHQLHTRLEGRTYELFYFHQSWQYRGLDPLLPSGSILAIETTRHASQKMPRQDQDDWERPIYLVRIHGEWICSYIEVTADTLTLIPHPAAQGVQPRTVKRSQAKIEGMVIGALFLLRNF